MSKQISRRQFLKNGLIGLGALSIPYALSGCNESSKNTNKQNKISFDHGVASGDPLQTQVILWTRVTVSNPELPIAVNWEISDDKDFNSIADQGKVVTSKTSDFTVKVDAKRLKAGTTYYYRFKCGDIYSASGKTKTLPIEAKQVKLAVCSCSNYPAGYFHVYREIAKQSELDAVLHLGDYIYEYSSTGYATEDASKLGRELASDNQNELIKLDDYRKRYALYRTDADLQQAHQMHPFIVIWDDHELSNDTWKHGAENHQAEEGDFNQRKLAALQAYFEWMPIRPVHDNNYFNIYRQFDFGGLVNLLMLDTRIISRDKQLNYSSFMSKGQFDLAAFEAAFLNPNRKMIGAEQFRWLQTKLQSSPNSWQVLGQQVLMAKMMIPAELLSALNSMDLASLEQKIPELMQIKHRLAQNDPSLTAVEKSRVNTVIPYNLDAWDGYAVEREQLYATLKQLDKKVVVLAGDTHNAWNANLYSQTGDHAGVELATSSVTSPGMETYLSLSKDKSAIIENAFTSLIDELSYCNLTQRGYLIISFDAQQLKSEWQFIDNIKQKKYQVTPQRTYQKVYDLALNAVVL